MGHFLSPDSLAKGIFLTKTPKNWNFGAKLDDRAAHPSQKIFRVSPPPPSPPMLVKGTPNMQATHNIVSKHHVTDLQLFMV